MVCLGFNFVNFSLYGENYIKLKKEHSQVISYGAIEMLATDWLSQFESRQKSEAVTVSPQTVSVLIQLVHLPFDIHNNC